MAPRVDRTIARVPRQVELAGPDPQGSKLEIGTRPGKNTEPIRTSRMRSSCHSSRVKVQPSAGDDRVVEPGPAATRGGRLAQLVRALP
jgi:hypothetical protein